MSEVSQAFLTTGLTVVGGLTVLVLGRIVEKLCLAPIEDLRGMIGEVTFDLTYYARAYSDTAELRDSPEARDAFRRHACHLLKRIQYNPALWGWWLFGRAPSKKNVRRACSLLIGLSNRIPAREPDDNETRVANIARLLRIRLLDSE